MANAASEKSSPGNSEKLSGNHIQERKQSVLDIDPSGREQLNAVFQNPLDGVPDDQLMRDVETFCNDYDLMEHVEDMKKGALVSKYPGGVQTAVYLSASEKEAIAREKTHKWDHPYTLYWLCGVYKFSKGPCRD